MNERVNRGRVGVYGRDYRIGVNDQPVVPCSPGTLVRHINTGEVFTVFSYTKGSGYQLEENGPHYSIRFFEKVDETDV